MRSTSDVAVVCSVEFFKANAQLRVNVSTKLTQRLVDQLSALLKMCCRGLIM